jgi:hypothetical protein
MPMLKLRRNTTGGSVLLGAHLREYEDSLLTKLAYSKSTTFMTSI